MKPANAVIHVHHHLTQLHIFEPREGSGLADLRPADRHRPARAEDLGLREICLSERCKVKAGAESTFPDLDPSGDGRPLAEARPEGVAAGGPLRSARLRPRLW